MRIPDKSGRKKTLRRREFLANLLFGGAVTVAGLQLEYPLVSRRDPEEDDWQVPDLNEKPATENGWDIPDDYLNNNPPAPNPPPPRKPPQPPVMGLPRGKIRLPRPEERRQD